MNEILTASAFFGVLISLLAYYVGDRLRRKFKLAILNPLLISIVLTILALCLLGVDYGTYAAGAKYLSWLLTPATVCLAIPLYEKLSLLKSNWRAIFAGILSGMLAGMCSILLMALLFGLSHAEYITLLPKSVTTAIGMGLVEEMGGYPSITAVAICITGVLGNIVAEGFLKLIRVEERVAKGVAIGSASHAIGTTRAMELGETEGAMSSLSIAVAGLMTVVLMQVFAQFL